LYGILDHATPVLAIGNHLDSGSLLRPIRLQDFPNLLAHRITIALRQASRLKTAIQRPRQAGHQNRGTQQPAKPALRWAFEEYALTAHRKPKSQCGKHRQAAFWSRLTIIRATKNGHNMTTSSIA